MSLSLHPMDHQWEHAAKARYQKAYPELTVLFRQILSRAFLRCHWIPNPLALDYLTKILIRFIPVSTSKNVLELALNAGSSNANDPREIIRYYENIGELILWWSGIHQKSIFQEEGKRSYTIAFEFLSDYEPPTSAIVIPGEEELHTSKRLQVNKMFSEQFENYQEILEKAAIIDDAEFCMFRDLFMTDDFSSN